MDNSQPLVSIIISFLNEERFIDEAIESVFAQIYSNWEILLIDDGSTDGSTEIARRYGEKYPSKVRYLEHENHQNRGVCASRNLAIRSAKGEYIAVLDADDVWLSRKLKQQVAILNSYPRAAMVYGLSQYWNSWRENCEAALGDYVPNLGLQPDTIYMPPDLSLLVYPLGQATAPCPSDLLFRRKIAEHIGGFEECFDVRREYQLYEDQAFLTKVYLNCPVFVSSECWDRYRLHPDSCDFVVKKAGQYPAVRLFFLNWLEAYLSEMRISDTRLLAALQNSLRTCRYEMSVDEQVRNPRQYYKVEDAREVKWWLRSTGPNVANLDFPRDRRDTVRIAIKKCETGCSNDIQLNQPRLQLRSQHCYVVNFLARADTSRSIFLGVAKAHAPWNGLGLYREIQLTKEWQIFSEGFTATEDEFNARIHFDVGNSNVSVEVAAVSLLSLSEGKSIEPAFTLRPIEKAAHDASQDARLDVLHRLEGEQNQVVRHHSEQPIQLGQVQFGTLRRLMPISRNWGLDRGLPIDRYYIENFLARHAEDIRGDVLEIEDDMYTRKFGGSNVVTRDVLHVVEGNPRATIVGDLTHAGHIPSNRFDCIILTQTLQYIYDVRSALNTLYRILKPDGVLLATFPGITQTHDAKWDNCWCWSFTGVSAQRLFGEVFPATNLWIQGYGNVLVAIAFLHGLAAEELTQEEMDYCETGYEVAITVRAVKPNEKKNVC